MYLENEENGVNTSNRHGEDEMRNFAHAMGGLLIGLLIGSRPDRGTKAEAAALIKYKFDCGLCSGETFFEALPHGDKEQIYDRDCKWCGMGNRVQIQPAGTAPRR